MAHLEERFSSNAERHERGAAEVFYNSKYGDSEAAIASWGLEVMRQLPLMDTEKDYPDMFDCFKWSTDSTSEDPFTVKPASMYNIRAHLWEYSEEALADAWSRLPEWYLSLVDSDPPNVYNEWKSALLPMEWQSYLLSSQAFLIQNTNEPNPKYEGVVKENPYHRAFRSYVNYEYEFMNLVLRGLRRYNGEICRNALNVEKLVLLQWMITLMPSMNVHHLTYRYSQMTPELEHAKYGQILSFKGYTSVTMNLLKTVNIVNWLGSTNKVRRRMVIMQFHIVPGSKFLIVPSAENEIILPHYCQFKLNLKLEATEFITFMSLELINDPTRCSRIENDITW